MAPRQGNDEIEIGLFAGKRERILSYLNGRTGWAKKQRKELATQAENKGKREPGAEIPEIPSYEEAERIMTDQFGAYIDEWLRSGRNSDGSEEPGNRDLFGTQAYWAVNQYLYRHHHESVPAIPGHSGEAYRVEMSLAPKISPVLGHTDPEHEAREGAIRLLIHFLNSKDKWQLGECYLCHRYFFPEQRPLRPRYARGAYCGECRAAASKDKTYGNRKEWTRKVFGLAVEAWPKCKLRTHPEQCRWVAMRVNEKLLPGDKRITMKWVTTNSERIAEKAEEIQDAKAAGIVEGS
jgi:hypothetical protein